MLEKYLGGGGWVLVNRASLALNPSLILVQKDVNLHFRQVPPSDFHTQ